MQYHENEAIALTQRLVRIESCNPGSYEGELSRFVFQWLKETGADTIEQEVFPGRNNVIAKLSGTNPDLPALVYICHLDTVPLGDGWDYDPLGAEIIGGKLYGRGSCDMKAGLAAGMLAFRHMAQIKQPLNRDFLFIASIDEEDVMTGADKAVQDGWITKDSLVLDLEPTHGEILSGHKGKTWFKIVAKGLAAHASTPAKGVDAVSAMGEFIASLNRRIKECPVHPEMGPVTATYGLINGGVNVNVVPGDCTLTIDLRLVPPVTNEESIAMVQAAAAEAEANVQGVHVEVIVTAQRPAIERDDESFLLKKLSQAYKTESGQDAKISFFPGYTDSGVVAALTGNTNCMSYGPGDLANAHKPNEYCECEDIVFATNVVTKLAENILL